MNFDKDLSYYLIRIREENWAYYYNNNKHKDILCIHCNKRKGEHSSSYLCPTLSNNPNIIHTQVDANTFCYKPKEIL